jgi:hypothetical protein
MLRPPAGAGSTFAMQATASSPVYRRNLLRALLTVLMWLIVGCVSLDDVAQLRKLADWAQQTLPAVVADIPASCQRRNVFLNDIPAGERPPSLQPEDCKPYQDVADSLTKDQNVLIAYFDALGALASNTPLSYAKTIDTDVTTIAKLPNLSKNTIAASTASQKIARVFADVATRSYRERKVNSIIERTDEAVQQLTTALKNVITTDYMGILSNEADSVDAYYQSPMAAARGSERLALITVQRQYHGDAAVLETRRARSVAYGQVMDSLASLHGKLKMEVKKKASLRQIAQEIGPDVSDLKDAISQLQTGLK